MALTLVALSHRTKPLTLQTIPGELRNLIYNFLFTPSPYGLLSNNDYEERARAKDLLWSTPNHRLPDLSERVLIGTLKQLYTFTRRADLCWLARFDISLIFTCKQFYGEARWYVRMPRGWEYVRIERRWYPRWSSITARTGSVSSSGAAMTVVERMGTVLWWPTSEREYQRLLHHTRPTYIEGTISDIPDDGQLCVSGLWQSRQARQCQLVILPYLHPHSSACIGPRSSLLHTRNFFLQNLDIAATIWHLNRYRDIDITPSHNLLITHWQPPPNQPDPVAAQYTAVYDEEHTMFFNPRTREMIWCANQIRGWRPHGKTNPDHATLAFQEKFLEIWVGMVRRLRPGGFIGPAPRLPRGERDCLGDVFG